MEEKGWFDPVCIFGYIVQICADDLQEDVNTHTVNKYLYGEPIIDILNKRRKPWHEYIIQHIPPEVYSKWGGHTIETRPGCITVVVGIEIKDRMTLETLTKLSLNLTGQLAEGGWSELGGKEPSFMTGISYVYDIEYKEKAKEEYSLVYAYNLSKEFTSIEKTNIIRSLLPQGRKQDQDRGCRSFQGLPNSNIISSIAFTPVEQILSPMHNAVFDILGYYDTPEYLPVFLIGAKNKETCIAALNAAALDGNEYARKIQELGIKPDMYQVKNN